MSSAISDHQQNINFKHPIWNHHFLSFSSLSLIPISFVLDPIRTFNPLTLSHFHTNFLRFISSRCHPPMSSLLSLSILETVVFCHSLCIHPQLPCFFLTWQNSTVLKYNCCISWLESNSWMWLKETSKNLTSLFRFMMTNFKWAVSPAGLSY